MLSADDLGETMSLITCRHCGKCCDSITTQISLTLGDVARIANFLGVDAISLFDQGFVGLKPFMLGDGQFGQFEVELGLSISCKFRKAARCTIYPARPLNCRLFPAWILAEASLEQTQKWVDSSYECIWSASRDEKSIMQYQQYTKRLAKVLEAEARVTDEFLGECGLKRAFCLLPSAAYRIKAQALLKTRGSDEIESEKQILDLMIKEAQQVLDKIELPDDFAALLNGVCGF